MPIMSSGSLEALVCLAGNLYETSGATGNSSRLKKQVILGKNTETQYSEGICMKGINVKSKEDNWKM